MTWREATKDDLDCQIGGTVTFLYGSALISAPRLDVQWAVKRLRRMSPVERETFMTRVNRALAEGKRLLAEGKESRNLALDLAADAALWYANEIVEERATLPPSPTERK